MMVTEVLKGVINIVSCSFGPLRCFGVLKGYPE